MRDVVELLQQAAVLALGLGGICTILQITSLRARALRLGAGLFALSLFLPYAREVVEHIGAVALDEAGRRVSGDGVGPGDHPGDGGVARYAIGIVLALVGHVALAVYLLRRYLRGPEAARRADAEREQVRRRERVRVPPQGEEP